MTHHRYLIKENSETRSRKAARMLGWFLFAVLMVIFWIGFFYVGAEEMEFERSQIEGR